MPDRSVEGLYSSPLTASRQGPLYNAFSYPTKISAESVAVFIACHTDPGDRVLDVFGGSGATGIAAILCGRPTPRMIKMVEERNLSPIWGARNAVVYEISVIGSLLARVMTSAPYPQEFAAAAEALVENAAKATGDIYGSTSGDGENGQIRHVIWSDVVRCPSCMGETTYADVRIRFNPLRFADLHECKCGFEGSPDDWQRVVEEVLDAWSGKTSVRRRRIPWRVYGKSASGNWSRPAAPFDADSEREISTRPLPDGTPVSRLQWGDLYRSGYHQGMTHLHDLYTARNFFAMATMWSLIDDQPEHLRDALRLLVLSYNSSHSTLMTRVVLKKDSTDFVLTGAQSGVLYVSGLPVEKNVYVGVRRKTSVFRQAFAMLHDSDAVIEVVNQSSTLVELPGESIDYVFTDPPFGGYIPYSEINQINELWLGRSTESENEAIVSPAQGKNLESYERLLTTIFGEVARVMKADADATLVFHSAHASVWQALTGSLKAAGLTVAHAGVLDKTQASFKQVNGHIAVSGDPLLLVRKVGASGARSTEAREVPTIEQLIAEFSEGDAAVASKLDDERLYSRVVGEALLRGIPMTLDAKTFYARRTGRKQ